MTAVNSASTDSRAGAASSARKPSSETSVKVSVKPVPGEHNTSNNNAEYPVIFSLSGG